MPRDRLWLASGSCGISVLSAHAGCGMKTVGAGHHVHACTRTIATADSSWITFPNYTIVVGREREEEEVGLKVIIDACSDCLSS